jgi:hypothetical protein
MYSPSKGLVWTSNFFLGFFVLCFIAGLALMLLAKIYNTRKHRKPVIILAKVCDWSLVVSGILWGLRISIMFL